MDQPSTSRAEHEIENILRTMESPRDILPDEENLFTDQDLYGILLGETLEDDWIDLAEEEVVTTENEQPVLRDAEVLQEGTWTMGNPALENIIPFTGNPGLKKNMTGTEPIDFFNLLFNNHFYDLIITCTNANGEILKSTSTGHTRFKRWKPISLPEFQTFIGIIFLMGLIKLNRLTDYWKKHYLFDFTLKNYMSRNRFFMILRALNVQNIPGNESIKKVCSLIDIFNKTLEEIYYPSKELTVDESLILWTGRLRFRQYMKNKVHKYGIKLYMLAENNGICMKIHLYAGAQDNVVGGRDHVKKVLRLLTQNYLNVGHSIYVNNFYASVDMANELLNNNTYLTGTLRQNKKGNPKDLINTKLQKNEACIMHNNKNVTVTKWLDKREVCFVSSEQNSEYIFLCHQFDIKYEDSLIFEPNVYNSC
ncbi:piggyBac transposable element-derived protein 4-like [Vanessa cardui]|uniref:piggyBac transposable element-derived protein 4-like n=1 Tax=Vanessa cardui TaxID=171605 RepID=UPI001F129EA9|nr:piggyBac transposable element-derived protein 4-like [Vanessa cardui]